MSLKNESKLSEKEQKVSEFSIIIISDEFFKFKGEKGGK